MNIKFVRFVRFVRFIGLILILLMILGQTSISNAKDISNIGIKEIKEIVDNSVIMQVNSVIALSRGVPVVADPENFSGPLKLNGYLFVPLRFIIESLNGTVIWKPEENKAVIKINGKTIELWSGDKKVKITDAINGAEIVKHISLNTAPECSNRTFGIMFVPVKTFFEDIIGQTVTLVDIHSGYPDYSDEIIIISDYNTGNIGGDNSDLAIQTAGYAKAYMTKMLNLKKSYIIKSEKAVNLTGQITTGSSIKSVSTVLLNEDNNNKFAVIDPVNSNIFNLSRLSSQLNIEKFENGKTYDFGIYIETDRLEPVKIGMFSVTLNISAPVITMTKTEYTLGTGMDESQALIGKIRAYYPISKINVYIGNMTIPINYSENRYSKPAGKLSLDLSEIKAGDPAKDILRNTDKKPGIYNGRIEVVSYGGVPTAVKTFTLKIVGVDNILQIEKNELWTRSGAKYNKWYGVDEDTPWCAVFQLWCFDRAGLTSRIGGSITEGFEYPYNWWNWYINQRRAYERDSDYNPQPGDIVFFDWSKNDGKDYTGEYCSDHVNHVEIIEKIDGNKLYTIGGNCGGGKGEVVKHNATWTTNSDVIIGYGANYFN